MSATDGPVLAGAGPGAFIFLDHNADTRGLDDTVGNVLPARGIALTPVHFDGDDVPVNLYATTLSLSTVIEVLDYYGIKHKTTPYAGASA